MTTEVFTHAIAYDVSCLPLDHMEHSSLSIQVEYRSPGLYSLKWRGECYSTDGTWDYEPLNSSRTDKWKKKHRFTIQEALRLANDLAPQLRIGTKEHSFTAADVLDGKMRKHLETVAAKRAAEKVGG